MAPKNSKSSNFIVQGTILAIAGVVARFIGLVYRVPMQRTLGDAGMGYYSAAFQIYSLMLIISSYSLPVAVSKLVAGYVAREQYKNAKRIYRCSFIFACVSGGIACFVVFYFADFLAGSFMNLPKSAIALRVLAPTLFIVAVMGVMRGFFQGNGTMMPTAVSQLIEQIVNAVISVLAAIYLFEYGFKVSNLLRDEEYAAAYGAAGGTLGTAAGALAGLICLILIYLFTKREFNRNVRHDETRSTEGFVKMFIALLVTVIPVILSTTIYNISDTLDQSMFNHVLGGKGVDEAARTTLWGMYASKYKVLTNVPVALASAICSSMMPSLTGSMKRGEYRVAKRKVSLAMRFTMILAIPSAVGLAVLGKPIISLLFVGEVDMPAVMLAFGSSAVVFYSMSTLSNGVLQGIDKMHIPIRNAVIALVLHLGILYVCLEKFDLSLYGVVISCVAFGVIMSALNWISISRHLSYKQELIRTFLIPVIASVIMGGVAFLSNFLLSKVLSSFISLIITIVISILVYFVVLIKLHGVREREIRSLPGGNILAGIARFLRLL